MNRFFPAVVILAALAVSAPLAAQIVPPGASVQLLDNGFKFTEGPLYDGNGNLYISDMWPSGNQAAQPSKIYKYNIASDQHTVVDANSGSANGTIFDPQGQMVSADRDRRQISRRTAANVAVVESVLVSMYGTKALNGPNDLVMDQQGGIYFTDPNFENRANPLTDAFYYLSSTGTLTQMRTFASSSDNRPNGIVLSPDGTVLYLALWSGKRILAYDVGPNGTLSNDRQFARTDITINGTPITNPVGPDGLTIDAAGNLYAAVKTAVFAWNPAGQRLFDLPVPKQPTNVEFGGVDGRTLFITAQDSLYGIELNVPSPKLGDYNGDGTVNAADYTVWRNTLGSAANLSADGNGNRVIDAADFDVWKNAYGTALGSGSQFPGVAVPEPAGVVLVLCASVLIVGRRRRGKSSQCRAVDD